MPPPTTTPTGDTPRMTDEYQFGLYPDGATSADEYHLAPGVCILPLAEDPPTEFSALKDWSPVVVLRLHAPYRIRHAASKAMKQRNPPVAPAPVDAGKFVFIGGTVTVGNALNSTLSSYDWSVSTDYFFVENCVSRVEDGFVLGTVPWTWRTTIDNAPIAATPQLGAVSAAGLDARAGYSQGISAALNTNGAWQYNCPSFYPGVLMNAEMDNGGPQSIPSMFPTP